MNEAAILNNYGALNKFPDQDLSSSGDVSMQTMSHNPVHSTGANVTSNRSRDVLSTPHFFHLVLTEEEKQQAQEEKENAVWVPVYETFSTPEMRRITLPLMSVWAIFGLTYYGVVLLVTRLYTEDNDDGDDGDTCSFNFPPILENSISEVIGIGIATYLINRVGRVKLQSVPYLLSAISILILGFHPSSAGMLIFAFIARGCNMTAVNTTWVITPVPMSALLGGLIVIMNRIISDEAQSDWTFSIANTVAAISSSFLPETNGRELATLSPISANKEEKNFT